MLNTLVTIVVVLTAVKANNDPSEDFDSIEETATNCADSCICQKQLGDQNTIIQDNDKDPATDFLFGYHSPTSVKFWSKDKRLQAATMDHNGSELSIGTGIAEKPLEFETHAIPAGERITKIRVRSSSKNYPPEVCNIFIHYSNGDVITNTENQYEDCEDWFDHTLNFGPTQMVIGFYSKMADKSMRVGGIYYYTCFDCNTSADVVSTPAVIPNIITTVNSGVVQETITFSSQPMVTCTPINVSVSPTPPSWLTVNYVEPVLTLTVDSTNPSDIGTYTFFVTSDYNSLSHTQKVQSFSVTVGACILTSYTEDIPGVADVNYQIPASGTVLIPPQTYTQTPACNQATTLSIQTVPAVSWISLVGDQIEINSADQNLHGTTVTVTYTSTPQDQAGLAVSSSFDVIVTSECGTTAITAPSQLLDAAIKGGDYVSTIQITDNYSSGIGLPQCGDLQIQRVSPVVAPTWLTGEVTLTTGEVTLTVNTVNAADLGGPYRLDYQASLVDFPSVAAATFSVDVTIWSECLNTVIEDQFNLQTMIQQIGTSEHQLFNEAFDSISLVEGNLDGVSYCGARAYSLVDQSTGLAPTFMSVTNASANQYYINLNALTQAEVGDYLIDLVITLVDYPMITPLTKTFTVRVLDCANAVITATAFTDTVASVLGGAQSQSVTLSHDNQGLCGPYSVAVLQNQSWLSHALSGSDLTATVDITNPAEVLGVYVASFEVGLVDYPSAPKVQVDWRIDVTPCQIISLTPSTTLLPSYKLSLFEAFELQLPEFTQVPACDYPIEYISLDTEIDQYSGLLSVNETDPLLMSTVREILFEARTVSAASFSSPIQTVKLEIGSGCESTEINAIGFRDVKLQVGGIAQTFDLFLNDTVSYKAQLAQFCGPYNFKVVNSKGQEPVYLQKQGDLNSVESQDSSDISRLKAPIRFYSNSNSDAGNHTLTLEIALEDYPDVASFVADFEISIEAKTEQEIGKPLLDGLATMHILQPNETWRYQLPPLLFGPAGNTNHSVVVRVNLMETSDFLRFDESKMMLESIGTITERHQGNYTVIVELTGTTPDGFEVKNRYSIRLQIQGPVLQAQASDSNRTRSQAEDLVPDEDKRFFTAKIQKISSFGLLTIKFSEDMAFPANLNETIMKHKDSQETALSVRVVPGSFSDSSKLTFDWTIEETTEDELVIRLKFDNPVYVSSEMDMDSLLVDFQKPEFFQSKSGSDFDPSSFRLSKELGSQQELSSQRPVERLQNNLMGSTLLVLSQNVFLNLLLSGSLSHLWGMINSLQLMVHTLLFNLRFPANAQELTSFFMMIASFNMLPTDRFFDRYMMLTPTQPKSPNFESLGYETINLLKNLGLLFFLFLLHMMFVLLFILTRKCRNRSPRWLKAHKVIRSATLGNPFIRFFMESYLEVSVSVFLNFKMMSDKNTSEIISSVFNVMLLALLFTVPVAQYLFMSQNTSQLEDKKFQEKHGTIYMHMDIKLNQKSAYAFPSIYMFRRMTLVVIAVFLDKPAIQLMMFSYLQTFILLYQGGESPLKSKYLNSHEIVNECVITLMMYHFFCLTDFVPDAETRFKIGYSFCVLFLAYLGFNMILLLYQSISDARWAYLKWKAKKDNKQKTKTASVGCQSDFGGVSSMSGNQNQNNLELFNARQAHLSKALKLAKNQKRSKPQTRTSLSQISEEISLPSEGSLRSPPNIEEIRQEVNSKKQVSFRQPELQGNAPSLTGILKDSQRQKSKRKSISSLAESCESQSISQSPTSSPASGFKQEQAESRGPSHVGLLAPIYITPDTKPIGGLADLPQPKKHDTGGPSQLGKTPDSSKELENAIVRDFNSRKTKMKSFKNLFDNVNYQAQQNRKLAKELSLGSSTPGKVSQSKSKVNFRSSMKSVLSKFEAESVRSSNASDSVSLESESPSDGKMPRVLETINELDQVEVAHSPLEAASPPSVKPKPHQKTTEDRLQEARARHSQYQDQIAESNRRSMRQYDMQFNQVLEPQREHHPSRMPYSRQFSADSQAQTIQKEHQSDNNVTFGWQDTSAVYDHSPHFQPQPRMALPPQVFGPNPYQSEMPANQRLPQLSQFARQQTKPVQLFFSKHPQYM